MTRYAWLKIGGVGLIAVVVLGSAFISNQYWADAVIAMVFTYCAVVVWYVFKGWTRDDWVMLRRSVIGNAVALPVIGVALVYVSVFFLFPAAVLIEQATRWFKQGEWVACSALVMFVPTSDRTGPQRAIPDFSNTAFGGWLMSPNDWIGLHRMVFGLLDAISYTAAAVLVGLAGYVAAIFGAAVVSQWYEDWTGRN